MASNQTEHCGLNQWAPEDSFLRGEFNEDNKKIDAAFHALPQLEMGHYRGSEKSSVDVWRSIELGYRPTAVIAFMNAGSNSGYLDGCAAQLAITEQPTADCLRLSDRGFDVKGRLNETTERFNPYRYLVIH